MPESKWKPLSPIIDRIMLVLARSRDGRWSWARTAKCECKYIDVRIDMRTGDCIILNRESEIITIEQLEEQNNV